MAEEKGYLPASRDSFPIPSRVYTRSTSQYGPNDPDPDEAMYPAEPHPEMISAETAKSRCIDRDHRVPARRLAALAG
jgi:hypothetical protein